MMEFVEYLPGALAAGWMAFKIAVVLRNGPATATEDQAAWD
jgi:hypothetical protein